MTQNMGKIDRIARGLFALLILVLYSLGLISGTVAIILGVFAGVFILTSILGFCPLYLPLGLNTKKKK
jgi:hypothetical protein